MSKVKAGGTAKNLRDSKPKYLGVKLNHGEGAKPGSIIVRQRGTRYMAGENVRVGRDHTLYAISKGTVEFRDKRKTNFDGKVVKRKLVSVV